MAKKAKISKTQAVRDYLKDHSGAMNVEIAAALSKQGITITPAHVGTIKTIDKKAHAARKAAKKSAAVEATASVAPAVVEKPATNGSTITLEQIKKVACTIRTLGGYQRMTEVLDVIKEMGGVKKFRDLAEAMTATAADAIPF
jgi:short-subunit dehydrogenase involved in D-alanine esterification of teichoic acids